MAAGSPFRKLALAAAAALLVVGFGELVRALVTPETTRLTLDIGPSTGMYLDGFTESEERLPATFRWTRERATVTLPLERRTAGGRLTLRYARFLPGSAVVRLFVDGSPAATFTARSGRFRAQELELDLPEEGDGPFRVELLVEDPSPERLGIAVDWMVFEEMGFRLRSLAPRLFLGALVLLGWATGFPLPAVIGGALLFAVAQALGFARAPFTTTHLHTQIGASAIVATALVAFLLRERRVALLFLVGFLLKGSALFHPSYFYPDVRLHRRHLEAFVAAEGGIVARGIAAQKHAFTAYPRIVAGKPYVFPYSPVFYLPFALLDRDAREMEALMKHVGLILAALELPLVFLLARFLFGTGAALWAALLAACLPPLTSRLLFAQWPTLAGHLFDVIALIAAAHLVTSPRSPRALFTYGASALASCLTYVSSILNLGLLTAFLAVAVREARWKLIALWAGIVVATVVSLYLPFVRILFTEIAPDLLAHGGSGSPSDGVATTLLHVHYFYGIGYIAFAIGGLWLAKRESDVAFRFLAVYGASFLGLLALRASAGMFKDLKELVFVAPFVAITCGLFLDKLSRPSRLRRASAIAVAAGLIAFSIGKHLEYLGMHTSLAP